MVIPAEIVPNEDRGRIGGFARLVLEPVEHLGISNSLRDAFACPKAVSEDLEKLVLRVR